MLSVLDRHHFSFSPRLELGWVCYSDVGALNQWGNGDRQHIRTRTTQIHTCVVEDKDLDLRAVLVVSTHHRGVWSTSPLERSWAYLGFLERLNGASFWTSDVAVLQTIRCRWPPAHRAARCP